MGCQPGACIWSLQSSSGICVGMYRLTYSLYHPRGLFLKWTHWHNNLQQHCSNTDVPDNVHRLFTNHNNHVQDKQKVTKIKFLPATTVNMQVLLWENSNVSCSHVRTYVLTGFFVLFTLFTFVFSDQNLCHIFFLKPYDCAILK